MDKDLGEHFFEMLEEMFDEEELEELLEGMLEEEDDVLDLFPLSRLPDETDLRSLLNGYTKAVLFRLADANGVEYRESWLKSRLVDLLYERLMETLDERVLFMSAYDAELVERFLFSGMGLGLSEEDEGAIHFYGAIFPRLIQLGLLFVWKSGDEVQAFVADEFLDKLGSMEDLREAKQEKIEFSRKAVDVLRAGISLYGVIDSKRFMALYEIADPSYEGTVDQHNYLIKVLPIMAHWHYFTVANPLFIASEVFEEAYEIQEFYFMLEMKFKEDYYKPSREEIAYFAEHSFDRRPDVYGSLKMLCEQVSDESELVMEQIEDYIRIGESVGNILDFFEDMDMIEFQDMEQVNQFLRLYSELSNNSRMWVNAGYKPVEMRGRAG